MNSYKLFSQQTFGDSMVLGVFLPEVRMFSFVFDESIVVFCRLGAWEPVDCELDEPLEPTKNMKNNIILLCPLRLYLPIHITFEVNIHQHKILVHWWMVGSICYTYLFTRRHCNTLSIPSLFFNEIFKLKNSNKVQFLCISPHFGEV